LIDRKLQLILLCSTVAFLIYIINMVRNKKLELNYILTWLFAALGLLLITVLPGAIELLSVFLNIQEPVNTLFLAIIFFLIMIIFSLTKVLSKNYLRVSALAQELGIVKLELEKMKRKIG
jgi:hypothetical protein